jgi:hypothetical protein
MPEAATRTSAKTISRCRSSRSSPVSIRCSTTSKQLRKGDIYNTVTGDIYKGKEGVRVIPCAYQRRFIEWAPRGQGSGAPVNIFSPDEDRPRTERSRDDNREYVVGGNGTYVEDTQQHFRARDER